jgi:outer membrane biosynthesis protein TonB
MADKRLPQVNEQRAGAGAVIQVKLDDSQFKVLDKMVVLLTNISDNLYNLTGFMGAQLTTLKQTEESLKAIADSTKVDEGAAAEKEKEGKGRKELNFRESNIKKIESLFDFLVNAILPFLIGFLFGLKKEFALISALVLIFRKQVFALIKEIPKGLSFLAGAVKTLGQNIVKIVKNIPKAFEAAVTGISKAFMGIYSRLLKVADFAKDLVKAFGEAAARFKTNFPKIAEAFAKIVDKVVDGFKGLMNVLKNNSLVGAARELIDDAVKMFVKAKNFLVSAPGKIAAAAKNTFRALLVIFSSTIENAVKLFTQAKQAFSGGGKLIENIVTKVSSTFMKFYSSALKVGQFFGSVAARLKDTLSPITKLFSETFGKVSKAVAPVSNAVDNAASKTSLITKAFNGITSAFSKIGELGKYGAKMAELFGKGTQVFSKLANAAKFLGPIGAIISTVTALFKGVSQAFKGFEEEGVFGALKGFTAGIISGFIGWIGDFATWVLGKLLKLLGFEELGDKIASLDFTEMLNQTIMKLFDNIKNAFTGMFSTLTEGFSKIFSGDDIIGGIIDVLSALPKLLIDLITAPFSALGDALKEVFDFDIGMLAKKLLLAMFPPDSMIGKIIGTGQMSEEVASAEAKKAEEKAKDNAAKAEGEVKATQTTPPAAEARPVREQAKPVATQTAATPAAATQTTQKPVQATQTVQTPAAATQTTQTPAVVTPAPVAAKGAAISQESQAVQGAQQGAPGGGPSNIIAPTSVDNSMVSGGSTNVSMPASATPVFGMIQSAVTGMKPAGLVF